MRQRRLLPSTKALLAFDAVMRNGSVTAAAQELSLTQSAVSRLVQALEDQLGTPLFARVRRRLEPLSAAQAYHREVARALDILQRGSLSVIANPGGGVLSLAVLPTLGARWLGPRLGQFLGLHPGVSVNLSTTLHAIDFASERFDAAIFFGPDDQGAARLKLFDERMTACVSPGFAALNPVDSLPDLRALPLLHLASRPGAWTAWFSAQDMDVSITEGMVMDQFSMMIQAAISGLGVALLPDYLARIEAEEGRLLPVLGQAVPVGGAYWLAWPEGREDSPPLRAFRDWLAELT